MDGANDFVTQATLELAVETRNQFRPPLSLEYWRA